MYSFNAEFCLPRPPEAVVFTAFKNPHRLYEKTSCFAVIFSKFFFLADALCITLNLTEKNSGVIVFVAPFIRKHIIKVQPKRS